MSDTASGIDIAAVAAEAVTAMASARQIAPFSARPGGFTDADAHRVTPLLRRAFEQRGERIAGRKIGFTNRRIWPEYGVDRPNWGYVTDRTVHELATTRSLAVNRFAEPRIEPEIMFGLGAAPESHMDEAALLDCIAWVSFGYEIVHSIFPNWKFTAADTAAANALHGALLVSQRHPVAPRRNDWLHELSRFEIKLCCGGEIRDLGHAANVLDGPLNALRHFVEMLDGDAANPPLAAGEIVSTGTLTRALPVAAGETWTAEVSGIPLEPISLRFE